METPDVQTVRSHVHRMMSNNLKQGYDHGLRYEYCFLCPSPYEYKWQWFWDSCFHAIAVAHADPQMAVRELETLFMTQRPDGFFGHIYFWGVRMGGVFRPWAYGQSHPGERLKGTALIQPPMLAQAVERVSETIGDAALAPRFMAQLDRYHDWLARNRVPDDDGLLVIVSPYESGTDQSPAFDEVLGFKGAPGRWRAGFRNRVIDLQNWLAAYDSERIVQRGRFRVKEALVNGLYAESLATMARLHKAQGNEKAGNAYHGLAKKVASSVLDKMLDRGNGGFMSIVGREERRVAPMTVGALVPLVMPGVPRDVADDIIERHITRRDEFWLRYPLPSVAANEPTFDPREDKLIWRGPTWVNTNWLVWRAMRKHGHYESADQLAWRTVELVAQQGLYEFYNPLSGEGMGARSFGWSALALDMAMP